MGGFGGGGAPGGALVVRSGAADFLAAFGVLIRRNSATWATSATSLKLSLAVAWAAHHGARRTSRVSDLEMHEQITLEEAFSGTVKTVRLKTFVQCAKCGGKGAEPGSGFEKCSTCDGQGQVREQRRTMFGNFSQVKTCVKCHGTGEVPKKPCSTCRGAGRVEWRIARSNIDIHGRH